MSGDDPELARDRLRVSRSWLHHAAEDLRVARVCMTITPPSLGTAAYHCQQAAEKAGSHRRNGSRVRWTDCIFRKACCISDRSASIRG